LVQTKYGVTTEKLAG